MLNQGGEVMGLNQTQFEQDKHERPHESLDRIRKALLKHGLPEWGGVDEMVATIENPKFTQIIDFSSALNGVYRTKVGTIDGTSTRIGHEVHRERCGCEQTSGSNPSRRKARAFLQIRHYFERMGLNLEGLSPEEFVEKMKLWVQNTEIRAHIMRDADAQHKMDALFSSEAHAALERGAKAFARIRRFFSTMGVRSEGLDVEQFCDELEEWGKSKERLIKYAEGALRTSSSKSKSWDDVVGLCDRIGFRRKFTLPLHDQVLAFIEGLAKPTTIGEEVRLPRRSMFPAARHKVHVTMTIGNEVIVDKTIE
jgi:hypothetical protein